jgi:hypothetical protein
MIALIVAAVGAFGVFVLPWFAPQTSTPLVSDSYAVGFANWAATLALLLTALALFLVFSDRTLVPEPVPVPTAKADGRRHARMALAALVAISLVIGLGLALLTRDVAHNESGFFLDRAAQVVAGYVPFSDFDYGYALIGLYGPVWLWRAFGSLGMTPTAAYALVYCILAVCSCWMLYILVRRVAPDDGSQAWILLGVGVVAVINTTMGIQYLLVRYLTPAIALLALHRWCTSPRCTGWRGRLVALGIALGGLAATIVLASPEMAAAGYVAILVYLAALARRQRDIALFTGGVLVLCAAALLLAGTGYASLVVSFARGALNFPVLPGPPAIVFVIATLTVAALLPGVLRTTVVQERPFLAALAAYGMALIPAAFGRADWGHMLANGLVLYVLAAAFLARRRPRLFVALLVAVVVSFGLAHGVYFKQFMSPMLLGSIANARTLSDGQFSSLERMLGQPQVAQSVMTYGQSDELARQMASFDHIAAPFGVATTDTALAFALASQGRLALDPVPGVGVSSADSEKKMAALADADCLLVLVGFDDLVQQSTRENTPALAWTARPRAIDLTPLTLFPLGLYERRPQPNLMGMLAIYINENFRRISQLGPYTVYVRRDP